jgi:FdhE protein
VRTAWQLRILRAEKLAAAHPFAKEILGFYIHVARFQEEIYRRNPERTAEFKTFLSLVENHGPEHLGHVAAALSRSSPETQTQLLETIWTATAAQPSAAEEFLAFAYLQPFAEFSRAAARLQLENYSSAICPWCNRKPALGVLRQQGDGGQRNLICGFCLAEWPFRRVVCAGCGEEDPTKLPVYTAAEMPHVRVECCDRCHGYIKSIDLTKNGLADPMVDELASIPLNLWAQERGYAKLHPNLLGM